MRKDTEHAAEIFNGSMADYFRALRMTGTLENIPAETLNRRMMAGSSKRAKDYREDYRVAALKLREAIQEARGKG